MPTYILCSSLTAEGGQTLHTNPDRMIEVNREIAEFGCKLVGAPACRSRRAPSGGEAYNDCSKDRRQFALLTGRWIFLPSALGS